ncbi:alpha-ketoacid dehydrogenase subunit beta [Defluviimonas sp. WL0002]|uniref:Alpha-ketoacid dehydrogenase subunit beta n=1 Tax=Albidovulum marisflavi TaxID=2984159 RepID=A0ABT2ZDI8_9RHOB|nr:alpha-ketoacid dehydrogenase subunit beta [Defluviimonas sp. WL0002]MCV2869118.1 alpha-ketoacid dehydrogenase subunit beta [Defluviimonas sp. WL0002]
MAELTMVEAINLALAEEMRRDERVVILGEDVGVDGGIFRVTKDLIEEFGEERVIDTPLAESGIMGVSVGMAMRGLRPVPEMQFSGFSYLGFHQIESHLSRMRWRTQGGRQVPVVVRMPYGAGVRALEHHSESREVFYTHMPGIKLVVPSGPRAARTLLVAAIRDPDPVVFFEPKALYRAFREEVSDEEDEPITIGKAMIRRDGTDLTLVAYGAMLPRAMEAAKTLADGGIEAEVIDLLTLSPLDHEAIAASVRRTGRCVVVHEAPLSYGPGAEIAARVMEGAFLKLQAPVMRVTGPDVNVPYFAREQLYLPDAERIADACRATMNY